MALALALAACGETDGGKAGDDRTGSGKTSGDKTGDGRTEVDNTGMDKGRNACEKAGILIFNTTKAQCGKIEGCEPCQHFGPEVEIPEDVRPEGEELECQGRELSAANACLKSPKRCAECVDMLVKAQCEERKPSDMETLGCLLLLGISR